MKSLYDYYINKKRKVNGCLNPESVRVDFETLQVIL